ncbi:general amidase [Lyophyllum atratum]|nr:general amidase [Lyophyllum atratum]
MATTWRDIVAAKKLRQQASIPKEWILMNLPSQDELNVTRFPESSGLLSAHEIEITNSDVDVLLQKLARAEWSSVQVTTAFAKRAIIAHQLTNCLTEIFIDRALVRASELDEHLKTTGKVVGALHGLPVSLKDQISLEGVESTMGYVSWIGQYAERNAVLVDALESLGAVLYVKTNIPQTLMWPETFNHVFGRTTNPHNRSLTSGGSSGGEGALIALKGAPIGVGSDIGGSVRIPSAFCGTYGFRPSTGRVPYGGSVNSLEGQDSLPSVLGPLSNSIGGLKAFIQGVLSQKTWLRDPLVIRKGWDEDEYRLAEHGRGKDLCFAILWNDGQVVPHPPVIRGLEMTKKALLAAGHKVIDWKPLKHNDINDLARAIFGAGMAQDFDVVTTLTGEPLISHMGLEQEIPISKPVIAAVAGGDSAYDLWQIQKKKRDLRREHLEYWLATASVTGTGRPVDAIISPVAPYTATPHGKNVNVNYTMVWNTLDYPALVIPVSKVDPVLDQKKPAHGFLGDEDKVNYELYEPATFKDGPVTVQVVGRTHEEEAVIAMAGIVDAALKAQAQHHAHSGSWSRM